MLPYQALIAIVMFSPLLKCDDECPLIVHYSKEYGMSIYAGIYLEQGSIIESCVGVPVNSTAIAFSALDYYMEGHNETHALVSLGYCMIYNHAPLWEDNMIDKYVDSATSGFRFSHYEETSYDPIYRAARNIQPGEQIFSYYGDDWFTSRGAEEIFPRTQVGGDYCSLKDPLNHFTRVPGCVVGTTIVSGSGVFAITPMQAGEYIEVSRALLLEEAAMHWSGPLQDFLWFRYDSRNSSKSSSSSKESTVHSRTREYQEYNDITDYAVLALGRGALYRAVPEGGIANVVYAWWTPECKSVSENKNKFESDLSVGARNNEDAGGLQHSSLGEHGKEGTIRDGIEPSTEAHENTCGPFHNPGECGLRLFVSFRAARYIAPGEELTVDLRVDPITQRRYASQPFSQHCL